MTADRWQEIKVVLADALELLPAERAAFLDRACGADESFRAEVESLIAHQQPGDSIVDCDRPVAGLSNRMPPDEQRPLQTDRRIGPYKIVREHGSGGMGAVYLATRADDEYRGQVAIKLIRYGMDTDFVLRRFRNERQILAALDHPNVARLLDG
ncbi:MAG TPA: serine/threonine protein kinase, partial [Blastocatellia bacterium]|nr:serine/threonine protein kinase [Blastocatellia bacterium]